MLTGLGAGDRRELSRALIACIDALDVAPRSTSSVA
jgi:hypothetical protein